MSVSNEELLEIDRYKRDLRLDEISVRLRALHSERWDAEKEARRIVRRQEALSRERDALIRERAALGIPLREESFRLAPMRRIPVETLVQIFLSADDSDVPAIGFGVATILSRVSSHWRAVACDTPGLWTSFRFPVFGNDPDAQLLQAFLDRSGAKPLTVELDCTLGSREGATGERQLGLIMENARRLYSLRFIGQLNMTLGGLKGNLPRLEILEFKRTWRGIDDAFADVPRLHTIRCSQYWDLEKLIIPFAQIRTIHLGSPFNGGVPVISQNITSLLSIARAAEPWSAPIHVIFIHLEHWRVGSRRGATPIPDYFGQFTAPRLRRLELSLFERDLATSGIQSFIERSCTDLTELTMRECSMRPAAMLELLTAIPNLRTLAIHNASPNTITDVVLRGLTAGTGQPACIAALITLRIDGSYLFQDAALLDMLESRRGAGLKTAELVLRHRDVPAPMLERFKVLSWMDISVFCLSGEKNMHRLMGSIPLPVVPVFGSPDSENPSPRSFFA